MTIHIDASGVLRDLDQFESNANRAIDAQFYALGKRVATLVYEDKSFGGSRLRLAISWAKRSENRLIVFTKPGYKHASFVNDGTRPHFIRGRGFGVLRFVINGQVLFRHIVFHPGTKATHYFDRATRTAFDEALPELTRRLDPAIQRFNR